MPTIREKHSRMTTDTTLKGRYEDVRRRIAEAAARCGRRTDDIVLVAVTKFASIDEIRELIQLGHTDFGESRVQNLVQRAAQIDEFLQRRRQLGTGDQPALPAQVRWHMIGHLQRNKVRKVTDVARLIHSVDSLRLAEELQAIADKNDEPIEILVQVNTSGEKSKFGIAPAATQHFIEQIENTMTLRVRGLMCMAPLCENPRDARPTFERCRELFDDVRSMGFMGESFNILSMGMTNDFEVAIECGANIVRIGSAIFGERDHADESDADDAD
jgi:PLP dependent protein